MPRQVLHPLRPSRLSRLSLTLCVLLATAAPAQTRRYFEQTYLPASHNWAFRDRYPSADRLFNAFDYGHAILYETLYARPNAPPSVLEVDRFDFITKRLLVHPPNVPLEETAIAPAYVKLVPELNAMFEWAHLLHRQIYDVWADERIPVDQKDARVAELLRYYRSRPELAFSSAPKSMELMEGQPYSRDFRKRYPKFNGLIWSYHWLQVGLYDALITAKTPSERRVNVDVTVDRFWRMLAGAPSTLPATMPMTAAVAPVFTARYPEAAIIFDNLHSLHDVVSDILANPSVPRERKRAELLRAAAMYRDTTSYVTSVAEWREMAVSMGVERQGGVVSGFLPGAPPATATPAMPAMPSSVSPAGSPHAGHDMATMSAPPSDSAALVEIQALLLADPVVRARVLANDSLRARITALLPRLAPADRARLQALLEKREQR